MIAKKPLKRNFYTNIFLLLLFFSPLLSYAQSTTTFPFSPPQYVCIKASDSVIIDGEIYDEIWDSAPWSDAFVDIRGVDYEKQPIYNTRMKMLWDDTHLYIAAELMEPHIWATLTQRDATLYWDNDFEVFIDPDGDTHHYFELEINAFGTEWDLLMTQPYRFGGTYLNGFTMIGLESAVKHYGTINNPTDEDEKWVVELKIPFKALVNHTVKAGDQWRMNFSRVEWLSVIIEEGMYQKEKGKEGFGHEENWVWAPTGAVDIHRPEYWGFVQFSEKSSGDPNAEFVVNPDETIKFTLRQLLNAQMAHYKKYGRYAEAIPDIPGAEKAHFYPTPRHITISLPGTNGEVWYINSDSRVWKER